jgi:hypothetical protein
MVELDNISLSSKSLTGLRVKVMISGLSPATPSFSKVTLIGIGIFSRKKFD